MLSKASRNHAQLRQPHPEEGQNGHEQAEAGRKAGAEGPKVAVGEDSHAPGAASLALDDAATV